MASSAGTGAKGAIASHLPSCSSFDPHLSKLVVTRSAFSPPGDHERHALRQGDIPWMMSIAPIASGRRPSLSKLSVRDPRNIRPKHVAPVRESPLSSGVCALPEGPVIGLFRSEWGSGGGARGLWGVGGPGHRFG
jgi:hypothetical protein